MRQIIDIELAFAQRNRLPRLTHVYVPQPVQHCDPDHTRSRPWHPGSATRTAALHGVAERRQVADQGVQLVLGRVHEVLRVVQAVPEETKS